MVSGRVTLIHHLTIMATSAIPGLEAGLVAVAATLSKGYDLDYMRPQLPIGWIRQFKHGPGRATRTQGGGCALAIRAVRRLIATPAGARVRWSRGTVSRDT